MTLPQRLVRHYLDHRLVLFAGAGVAQAGGLPSWTGLFQHVLAYARADQPDPETSLILDRAGALHADGALLLAFSELQRAMTPVAYSQAVGQALDDDLHAVPALAQAIAGLAPTLRNVVTSNLDRFLERAFAGDWPVATVPQLDQAQREHTILKFHGCRTDRNTWVLTRREYDALMHRPMVRDHLRSLYRSETLLFVGYGLQDPDLDALLTEMRALAVGAPPQHFALMPRGQVDPSHRRHLLAEAGITVLEYDPASDHRALLDLLHELAAHQTPGTATSRPVPTRFAARLAPPPAPARVLMLAANPGDTARLRLDEEAAQLQESIRGACGPHIFELHTAWAVDFPRLLDAVLCHRPHVLHFAGHGAAGSLHVAVAGHDMHARLRASELADLVAELRDLRCLVLNACESGDVALAVLPHVPCVVAMHGSISDEGARTFAASFYRALGRGVGVGPAFRLARAALAHRSQDERDLPRLHVADDVDPEVFCITNPPS